MSNVSPFLIKTAIDNITPNVQISRIRDGSLLLKTIDQNQAVKLMKQSTLAGEIGIKICEHPTLNQSRGTIHCPDLISLKDEGILEGLKESHVVAVRRMTRITKEKKSEDTGTFILTFNLSQIPLTMDVGFYNCRVRQYVPAPLRCTNCLKFGPKADQCRGNKVCADCAQLYHDNGPCSSKQVCVNCRNEHNSWSKKCPIYEDEFEIQRIRVTEKLPMREARKKRRSQVPAPIFATTTPNRSFAGVLRESLPTHNEQRREHQDRHPAQPTDKQLNEKHEVGRQLPTRPIENVSNILREQKDNTLNTTEKEKPSSHHASKENHPTQTAGISINFQNNMNDTFEKTMDNIMNEKLF
ncbi:uncharacterized protein LOC129729294 [Wyeomyia smithii]|uniref:uncharacterized protein LOC129729294 n=1 Tax=Wyeomyia smithii TaxID=174621 RepID=UPI002467AF90|nr:uncharacterized protein LOC129729294 [Wyeomyia smithii]